MMAQAKDNAIFALFASQHWAQVTNDVFNLTNPKCLIRQKITCMQNAILEWLMKG